MGRHSLIAIVLVLGMLLALTALVRGQEERRPAGHNRTTWEYRVVEMSDLVENAEDDEEVQAIESHFNALGREGWEFAQIHLRVAVFKKPRE